jgi:hypothetical protein
MSRNDEIDVEFRREISRFLIAVTASESGCRCYFFVRLGTVTLTRDQRRWIDEIQKIALSSPLNTCLDSVASLAVAIPYYRGGSNNNTNARVSGPRSMISRVPLRIVTMPVSPTGVAPAAIARGTNASRFSTSKPK